MKLITSISLSAILLAVQVAAQDYNPIGQPCDSPGAEGCNANPSQNGGNAYIYQCGPADTFVYLAGCACPTCCSATATGAYCT
ncbi:hypothetical protein CONPUDRAFT_154649 [Coniophora puteana RWD-64-598 SS2]|uniref:Uncharacterized protein n=1 Tax=Coniophora puteana (strain RWD-64-598) TaxID=741705 RepID=A0A5M3MNA0_CONPW|nr:uncharacterized protein CONPUDRAFT_154649 [Coniophora puteana RWD-64-598 SS2]EIW80629.1 hypothetical protein CONPUDRAFT_154649 [Coniophora puteana RWD-64-598 SS2]